MRKTIFIFTLAMFSFLSKGQSDLENRFSAARAEMSLRNMYQTIAWQMQPINEYLFDQSKGEVKYLVEDKGYEVIAEPKILGTFNLDDKTFLWSDENPSIDVGLSDQVSSFRETLPKKYQKAKFKSDIAFNGNLLALFSHTLNANAFDIQRHDNTIIYYSLLEIRVFNGGKEVRTLEPKNHVEVLGDEKSLDLIREFHKEKLEVNALHNAGRIDTDKAFEKIERVHLKYWLNEDSYFFPSLCWPCDFDEKSVVDWKVFKTSDERVFVMYTTLAGGTSSYAYEIDTKAKGRKVIINEY
ncbi:MAG: hypothetical protein Roseis2KO_49600 [Roseivirga sp.]